MLNLTSFSIHHAEKAAKLHENSFLHPWPLSTFQSYANKDSIVGSSALYRGELVSFCLARKTLNEAELFTIATCPEHRSAGYARKTLQYLIQLLSEHKIETLFLEVNEENTFAMKLYQRLGFRRVGNRPSYYPSPTGKRSNALIYNKVIS